MENLTLEQRVEALERAAAGAQPSYAPLAGMKVAADGAIEYDFDGHVHASGVDLDAGDTGTPAADRQVRWLDPLTRIVRAANLSFGLTTDQDLGAWSGQAYANVLPALGSAFAAITATAGTSPSGNTANVAAQAFASDRAPAPVMNIIDGNGHSDFVRGGNLTGKSGRVGSAPVLNLWLPASFTLPYPAASALVIAGSSGYVATTADTTYGLTVDGVTIGASGFFFNQGGVHHHLPPCVGIARNLSAGAHSIQLTNPFSTLNVDSNDSCWFLVIGV